MMATILPFPAPESNASMTMPDGAGSPHHDAARADSGDRWAALMVRAQDGDRQAYHALLAAIVPYLRAIAIRHLGRGEDAEDAVQEILIVIHDIRHTYEVGRPFKPWLGTIASRRCIDLLRRRSRRLSHEVASEDGFELHAEPSAGPDEATARQDASREVRDAVERLSPKQREAVRMVHLSGLSLAEAASRSRQSVGSLKVACHRALKSLKQVLGDREHHHD
ncbi:RNA polymerase sigma factor [Cognatilysobacter tabacisoli]|uniref:RNA polymerase sigma factor n=1 Tax=Cognatilysobacter tabacisoli TaxID=2315424 RepID=UPI0018C87AD0|nr:RNA polymerase sigma factor [Lysobacter tabacisoli]